MKIPQYIDKLINKRYRLARDLNSVDCILSEWLDKNGIEVESYDVYGGCEMYCNPDASAVRIRQAIRDR